MSIPATGALRECCDEDFNLWMEVFDGKQWHEIYGVGDVARKKSKKIFLPPIPRPLPMPDTGTTPKVETAVVYNDELPWDKDKGIVYEIKERHFFDLMQDCWRYEWTISFGTHSYGYQRNFYEYRGPSEALLDMYRKDAQMDILTRAHKDGVI